MNKLSKYSLDNFTLKTYYSIQCLTDMPKYCINIKGLKIKQSIRTAFKIHYLTFYSVIQCMFLQSTFFFSTCDTFLANTLN